MSNCIRVHQMFGSAAMHALYSVLLYGPYNLLGQIFSDAQMHRLALNTIINSSD